VIVVVMPSRGRPRRAAVAVQAIRDTARLVSTSVVLAVDADDPELPRYQAIQWPGLGAEVSLVVLEGDETGDLIKATNTVSMRIAEEDPHTIIGNFGDDHVARTPGWDKLVEEALREPGIAYGDDLIQGAHLPTAPFISARIVLALGWFFLPTCKHLYGDDGVKRIGRAIGRLHYLSDVVIEHVHPAVGKTEWDAGYERANNVYAMERDKAAYIRWLKSDLYTQDIRNIERAIA
jgi:hypothetical protein